MMHNRQYLEARLAPQQFAVLLAEMPQLQRRTHVDAATRCTVLLFSACVHVVAARSAPQWQPGLAACKCSITRCQLLSACGSVQTVSHRHSIRGQNKR
eukprot:20246-Heterococcus_DN1.PRE.2